MSFFFVFLLSLWFRSCLYGTGWVTNNSTARKQIFGTHCHRFWGKKTKWCRYRVRFVYWHYILLTYSAAVWLGYELFFQQSTSVIATHSRYELSVSIRPLHSLVWVVRMDVLPFGAFIARHLRLYCNRIYIFSHFYCCGSTLWPRWFGQHPQKGRQARHYDTRCMGKIIFRFIESARHEQTTKYILVR